MLLLDYEVASHDSLNGLSIWDASEDRSLQLTINHVHLLIILPFLVDHGLYYVYQEHIFDVIRSQLHLCLWFYWLQL